MTLRTGSTGDQVLELQTMLVELGFNLGRLDGQFGQKTKRALVAFQVAYLVDGIGDQATVTALQAAHKAHTQRDIKLIIPVPHGLEAVKERFGDFAFEEAAGGSIVITDDWAERNIVTANLPVVGKHPVHRELEPVLRSVMQNLKDRGLDGEINQFGTWCPRHKMHNPRRSLSTHSWAIACDINWATNPVGRVGDIDPGIVDSFERHGFNWGGRWGTRDDMHFQYAVSY